MPNGNILSTLALSLLMRDGSGDDLLKSNGNPKNESFVIPPATITGPHDLQPQSLDLGVCEEWEDDPGVDEGPPSGAEVLDSNDDMDEDNEIPFEIDTKGNKWSMLCHKIRPWDVGRRMKIGSDISQLLLFSTSTMMTPPCTMWATTT